MATTRGIARSAVWLGFAAAFQAILQIAVVAVLARFLGPYEFGLLAATLVIVDILLAIGQLGLGRAVVQAKHLSADNIRAAFTYSVLMGWAMALVAAALSGPIAGIFGLPEVADFLRVVAISMAISSVAVVGESLMIREMRGRELAIRRLAAYFGGYGVIGIGCAIGGLGAWALVFALLGEAAIKCLLVVTRGYAFVPFFKFAAVAELFKFGSGSLATRLISAIATQSDRIVVLHLLGAISLGLYTRSYQLMRFPATLIGGVVDEAIYPAMARANASGTGDLRLLLTSLSILNILLIPAAAFVALNASDIVEILLGPGWSDAAPLLAIFSLAMPFRSTLRLASAANLAQGKSWTLAGAQLLSFGLAVTLVWFGSRYGLVGAVAGSSAGIAVQFLTIAFLAVSRSGGSLRELALAHVSALPIAALTVCSTSIASTACHLTPLPTSIRLVVAGVVAASSVCLAAYLLPNVFLGAAGPWLADLAERKGLPSSLRPFFERFRTP